MTSLTVAAPAKINWSLDIVGQREDGYHLLKTVMQQIALADRLELGESAQDSLSCAGLALAPGQNIAFKAWLALKNSLGLKQCLAIRIKKNIPPGGGLAGGSSDAAAVLKGANQLFGLGLDDKRLAEIGLGLGADVPFCLLGKAALAQGVGELLTPLAGIARQEIVLANPGIEVPTGEIFRRFSFAGVTEHPRTAELIEALKKDDKKKIALLMANLLETVTLAEYPPVKTLKEEMKSLGLAPLMSGSGGSVFAVADSEKEAAKAAKILRRNWPFAVATYTLC